MLVVGAVAASGGISAMVDLRIRRVPNVITGTTAVAGLALAALHLTGLSLTASLVGLAVGVALMMPGHVLGATGAGDVKLFAALGTLLGPAGVATAFVYTAIAGGLMAVVVALGRRRLQVTVARTAALVRTGGANTVEIEAPACDNRFAYAPAIAVGALVAALRF